ncbi:uncharacterized protein LOC135709011 [Ochlerotatus camptorhynchus]|uniref:uncharacterized protein LOC135709011 n=1 Tax=Ochlerotatus camptorhynchus TaxID=644619 RepID=UPI0031DE1C73
MYANGYKYWLAYKKGTSGYYRCCRYKVNCPGRCVVDEDGVVRNTTAHNHQPEADRVIVDRFRKVLTQRAAAEGTDLHVIYLEEATNRHADASLLYTFSQAESCMRKARRKMHPQEPGSMAELKEILESSDWFRIHCGSHRDQFYQTTVSSEDATSLVLWHRRTLDAMGRIDDLYLDCSLQNSAGGSSKYHVLVGLTTHRNSCVPAIYCIMTERSYAGFAAIFAYVREQLGVQIIPATISTEPDHIIQSALEISFPEATVKVYWHHYTAAVLEQMRQLGLGRETTKGHACSALRMLLVLPLLPDNYMNHGLEALRKWMKEKEVLTENFAILCDFVQYSWLNSVGAKRLSIFGQIQCTSNLVKTFLRELRNQSGLQRCSIWQMLETLAQLATKQFVKLSKKTKRPARDQPEKTKSKIQLLQETVISQATQQWIRTPVHLRNPLQFLQLCSHCINDAMIMESFPNIKNDEQYSYSNNISLNVPAVPQTCFQESPILTGTTQQTGNVLPPPVDPPPLAFFPKIRQAETNRIAAQFCYGQTEPPPLVPFTTSSKELQMQSGKRVYEPP